LDKAQGELDIETVLPHRHRVRILVLDLGAEPFVKASRLVEAACRQVARNPIAHLKAPNGAKRTMQVSGWLQA
jgi:fatty acid/phospholipid biosynthesis enzyme